MQQDAVYFVICYAQQTADISLNVNIFSFKTHINKIVPKSNR